MAFWPSAALSYATSLVSALAAVYSVLPRGPRHWPRESAIRAKNLARKFLKILQSRHDLIYQRYRIPYLMYGYKFLFLHTYLQLYYQISPNLKKTFLERITYVRCSRLFYFLILFCVALFHSYYGKGFEANRAIKLKGRKDCSNYPLQRSMIRP